MACRRGRPARIAVLVAAALVLSGCTAPAAPGPPSRPAAGSDSAVSASRSTPTPRVTASRSAGGPAPTASASGFDLDRHSVDAPGSIWVVVDKRRPLQPKGWVPPDLVRPAVPHTNAPQLRRPAAAALERLVAGAARDGVRVVSLSAYRPYTVQRSIYERNVRAMGRAAAERLTARPGFSEHQTGLADDLGDASGRCPIETCFATTPAGRWLAANAWRYGWVQRYPKGRHAQTGIQWEPWHYRFVGTALARHMHAVRQPVLERVLGLPASPDYR